MNKIFDVIVVGAGYSGLCASYHLKKCGLDHIVFERHTIGHSWRTQRWDNFRFNSTNKLNVLPGENVVGDPDKFGMAPGFVHELEQYVKKHQLPVHEHSKIIAVDKQNGGFSVTVSSNGTTGKYLSRQVIIASGISNEARVPALAKNISKDIVQLHTCEYKNATQLPAGNVLVVGGGQSGIQITEDLVNAGRKVYFATSKVGRIPRWYRGKDIFYWVKEAKLYEVRAEDIEDPKMLNLAPPHVAGTGNGKESLSLQSLAKRGAIILGKLGHAEADHVSFQLNAAEHIRFADEFSQKLKHIIDEYIAKNKIAAPAPHYDEADVPDTNAECDSKITSINLKEKNITSIIWTTGFDHDHKYIKLPLFDKDGKLKHKNGIPELSGIYFLGYPWLRSRQSPILFGIIEDAVFIVDKIYQYSKTGLATSPTASS